MRIEAQALVAAVAHARRRVAASSRHVIFQLVMRSCLCLEIGQAVLAKYDAALLDIDHLNSTARPAFIFDILILQIANMSADREQWERALADAGTRENQLMLDKASLQKVLLFSLI